MRWRGASAEKAPKTTACVTAMTAGPQEGASAEVRGDAAVATAEEFL